MISNDIMGLGQEGRQELDNIIQDVQASSLLQGNSDISVYHGPGGMGAIAKTDTKSRYRWLGKIVSTGPKGQADFTDERYWVQSAYPIQPDKNTSVLIPKEDNPSAGDCNWVQVTNLPETTEHSHNLKIGTPVIVYGERGYTPYGSTILYFINENIGEVCFANDPNGIILFGGTFEGCNYFYHGVSGGPCELFTNYAAQIITVGTNIYLRRYKIDQYGHVAPACYDDQLIGTGSGGITGLTGDNWISVGDNHDGTWYVHHNTAQTATANYDATIYTSGGLVYLRRNALDTDGHVTSTTNDILIPGVSAGITGLTGDAWISVGDNHDGTWFVHHNTPSTRVGYDASIVVAGGITYLRRYGTDTDGHITGDTDDQVISVNGTMTTGFSGHDYPLESWSVTGGLGGSDPVFGLTSFDDVYANGLLQTRTSLAGYTLQLKGASDVVITSTTSGDNTVVNFTLSCPTEPDHPYPVGSSSAGSLTPDATIGYPCLVNDYDGLVEWVVSNVVYDSTNHKFVQMKRPNYYDQSGRLYKVGAEVASDIVSLVSCGS